jgi:hypothetical protein
MIADTPFPILVDYCQMKIAFNIIVKINTTLDRLCAIAGLRHRKVGPRPRDLLYHRMMPPTITKDYFGSEGSFTALEETAPQ